MEEVPQPVQLPEQRLSDSPTALNALKPAGEGIYPGTVSSEPVPSASHIAFDPTTQQPGEAPPSSSAAPPHATQGLGACEQGGEGEGNGGQPANTRTRPQMPGFLQFAMEEAEREKEWKRRRDNFEVPPWDEEEETTTAEGKDGEYYEKPKSSIFDGRPGAKKAWLAVYRGAYMTYMVADRVGEKVADILGITDSRFQYALDEHNRQKADKKSYDEQAKIAMEERKQRQEARARAKAAPEQEEGEAEGSGHKEGEEGEDLGTCAPPSSPQRPPGPDSFR